MSQFIPSKSSNLVWSPELLDSFKNHSLWLQTNCKVLISEAVKWKRKEKRFIFIFSHKYREAGCTHALINKAQLHSVLCGWNRPWIEQCLPLYVQRLHADDAEKINKFPVDNEKNLMIFYGIRCGAIRTKKWMLGILQVLLWFKDWIHKE